MLIFSEGGPRVSKGICKSLKMSRKKNQTTCHHAGLRRELIYGRALQSARRDSPALSALRPGSAVCSADFHTRLIQLVSRRNRRYANASVRRSDLDEPKRNENESALKTSLRNVLLVRANHH